jgi:transcriptional regulator with XRE-family HTH domain
LADHKRFRTPLERTNDDALTDVHDGDEQAKIGARLKEAREYVGLLQEDVASALGIPRASVSALESGKRRVTGLEVRRLARIYRRPVGWLLGEVDIELTEAEPLFRAAEALSQRDRDQVLRFAEFLAAAGKPAASGRAGARPSRPPRRLEGTGDEADPDARQR